MWSERICERFDTEAQNVNLSSLSAPRGHTTQTRWSLDARVTISPASFHPVGMQRTYRVACDQVLAYCSSFTARISVGHLSITQLCHAATHRPTSATSHLDGSARNPRDDCRIFAAPRHTIRLYHLTEFVAAN